MKFKKFLVCIMIGFLFHSCFQLEELPVNPIKEEIQVSIPRINFFNSYDTIYVRNEMYFNIDFVTPEQVLGHKLTIGNRLISEGGGVARSFYFQSKDVADGYKKMELTIYLKSKTGSIADQIGAEAAFITYERILFIDNSGTISPPTIKGFEVKNGDLYIIFKPYTDFGFEKWSLDGFYPKVESTNPKDTAIIIPDFVGGSITVGLVLHAKNQQQLSSSTYSFDYNLKFDQEVNGDLNITWNEIPFSNLLNVSITTIDTLIELKSGSMATIKGPHTFPHNKRVNFVLNKKDKNGDYSGYELVDSYWIRDNIINVLALDFFGSSYQYKFRGDSIVTFFHTQGNQLFEAINY